MSEVLILELLSLPFLPFSTENGLKQILSEKTNYTIDDQFNSDKRDREKEIDRL
jgi:hypothetical protein